MLFQSRSIPRDYSHDSAKNTAAESGYKYEWLKVITSRFGVLTNRIVRSPNIAPPLIPRQIPNSARIAFPITISVLNSRAAAEAINLEVYIMADNNAGTHGAGLDLLTKAMNDIAGEIGEMDPGHPFRPERIQELHALTELSNSTKAERNKFIYDKMDSLAREVDALKPRDPRRADIVNEIIRLSHLILK